MDIGGPVALGKPKAGLSSMPGRRCPGVAVVPALRPVP